MIYLLRHGERADNGTLEDKQAIQNPLDPHLTANGHEQAKKAGEVIRRLTKESVSKGVLENKKYKYMVVSSPFLRCLQTAMNIMNSLPTDEIYQDSIFVQPGASEILYKNWFPSNILQELMIGKVPTEEFRKNYIKYNLEFNKIDESACFPLQYPEDEYQYYCRISSFYENLKTAFLKNYANEGVILIIVTHGWAVHGILEKYGSFEYGLGVDYCSINQLYHSCPHAPPAILTKQYHCHIYDLNNAAITKK